MHRPQGEARSFFPSSATTANDRHIPADEIMNSASCGTASCHRDIYEQWFSSQHHYGSFSNPFYRRNVEYIGERLGDAATNFCGGCHDPAPTFSGQMSAFLDPESSLADAGVSCVGCHSVVRSDVVGNGSYVMERPQVYPFAYNQDKRLQALNRALIKLKPGPHRRAFLKEFHIDNSEFCAACHKVHIPEVGMWRSFAVVALVGKNDWASPSGRCIACLQSSPANPMTSAEASTPAVPIATRGQRMPGSRLSLTARCRASPTSPIAAVARCTTRTARPRPKAPVNNKLTPETKHTDRDTKLNRPVRLRRGLGKLRAAAKCIQPNTTRATPISTPRTTCSPTMKAVSASARPRNIR